MKKSTSSGCPDNYCLAQGNRGGHQPEIPGWWPFGAPITGAIRLSPDREPWLYSLSGQTHHLPMTKPLQEEFDWFVRDDDEATAGTGLDS